MSEKASIFSKNSKRSSRTNSSKVDTMAEIAALKVKMEFIDKEAELQQLEMAKQTEIRKLQTSRKLAMAEARLNVLDQEIQSVDDPLEEVSPDISKTRYVADYVKSLPELQTYTKEIVSAFQGPVDTPFIQDFINPQKRDSANRPLMSTQMPVNTTDPQLLRPSSVLKPIPPEISVADLTRTLAEQISLSRLPPPEPSVFEGDPLKYPAWKSSFETLIEGKGISSAERLYYLKKYLAGEAGEAVEGYFLLTSEGA